MWPSLASLTQSCAQTTVWRDAVTRRCPLLRGHRYFLDALLLRAELAQQGRDGLVGNVFGWVLNWPKPFRQV